MEESNFIKNDGGRSASGFKGDTGDCVVRAIAIASGLDSGDGYRAVYNLMRDRNADYVATRRGKVANKLKKKGSTPRNGNFKAVYHQLILDLGFEWTPTMSIGSGTTVHLRSDELPKGNLICRLSKHIAAVKDGVLHDNYNCSRGGTRAVYGYYRLNNLNTELLPC